jgi:3(or 17)beta-hydroxysteroid dehydrogenase
MNRVQGLVAIVTGAASGLGLATAEMLAAEGATVVLTDINEQAGRDAAARIGSKAIFMKHDVTSEADWGRVTQDTAERFGRLDILVNNAGIPLDADPEQTTLEQFRYVNRVMSEGVFLGCKHAIPVMASGAGGSIINMSSVAALQGYGIYFAYSAAKGAVRSMTKSVAIHCQDKGYKIRCNSVHPAAIDTPMVQRLAGRPGQPLTTPTGVLPANTPGAPSDVAALVLYLASPESRYVTGAELVIDNGLTIRSALQAT